MAGAVTDETVITQYLNWLFGEFEIESSDSGCFLVTPFEKPDGEGITLELENLPNGNILINDMGDTLGYLFVNGLTLSKSVMNKAIFISKCHGVTFEGSFLSIETKPEDTGRAVHELIQTVIAITGLIHLRRSTTTRRTKFDNEVESLIIRSGATYESDYQVMGTREKHNFRFYVNSGPNILIQPLTATTESAALKLSERWAHHFQDTIQSEENWYPVAVLDDGIDKSPEKRIWTPAALAPIKEFAIPWTENARLSELLGGRVA